MGLTLELQQMQLLADLSSCVQPVVDDFMKAVFEEYIDFPLEKRKMITAEKAVRDFEVAVSQMRDLITEPGGNSTSDLEIAFSEAKDTFNVAAATFNRAVGRFDRRTSIYMKCSPLTRGAFSPRDGSHWDPWADDATSPRREEFAEMSFLAIVIAVFGLFAVGSLLSSRKIGMPVSVHVHGVLSKVNAKLPISRFTASKTSVLFSVPRDTSKQKTLKFLISASWRKMRENFVFHAVDQSAESIDSVENGANRECLQLKKSRVVKLRWMFNTTYGFWRCSRLSAKYLRSLYSGNAIVTSPAVCPSRRPFEKHFSSNAICHQYEMEYLSSPKLLNGLITQSGWISLFTSFKPVMSAGVKLISSLNYPFHSRERRSS